MINDFDNVLLVDKAVEGIYGRNRWKESQLGLLWVSQARMFNIKPPLTFVFHWSLLFVSFWQRL